MAIIKGATFKLEIKLEGADFESYPTQMLQRLLKGVIRDIGNGVVFGYIANSKGKVIGNFDVEVY